MIGLGWFDHWMEKHHEFDPSETARRVKTILGEYNASMNFYMFVGGTNFGFYNGANNISKYTATVTSYDYDAPISESGDVTQKYIAIREVIRSLEIGPDEWPRFPKDAPKGAYKSVTMKRMVTFPNMMKVCRELYGPIIKPRAYFMERLDHNDGRGQNYGMINYRGTFDGKPDLISIHGEVHDKLLIFINDRFFNEITMKHPQMHMRKKDLKETGNTIDILIDNQGRVNFRRKDDYEYMFEAQHKGFSGILQAHYGEGDDAKVVNFENYEHFPMEFDTRFYEAMMASKYWTDIPTARFADQDDEEQEEKDEEAYRNANVDAPRAYFRMSPTFTRGTLVVPGEPKDTFFDMTSWHRGFVFVNGFNLGRYWHVGPQHTLYVPAQLLNKGENTIVVWESKLSNGIIEFVGAPEL